MTARIVLVANWLDDVGGVQTATRSLAAALAQQGHRVTLVSVLPPVSRLSASSGTGVPTLYSNNRIRRAVERGGITTRVARLDLFGLARARRRLRLLAVRADAIIAMDVFAAEIATASAPAGVPVLAQFHNTATALDGTRDLRRLLAISDRMTALVALTEADAAHFRNVGFPRVRAIPNVIAPAADPSTERRPLVVGLGRYTAVKRFDLLLRAWVRVPSEIRANWRLELHGEGPENGSLQRASATEASIDVLGPTSDVTTLLASAAILVLPSTFEGLPMVLLEAMSSGVACIATRSSPGVAELVDGAGVLVDVDDEDALVAALGALLSDEHARAAAAAEGLRRLARFSPDAVVRTWEELLRSVAVE